MEIQEAREIIEDSIRNYGFRIFYTSGNYGSVSTELKAANIPLAKTRSTLYVLCHEAYHVFHPKTERTYIDEMRAEKKAHEYMRMFGFSVPRKQTNRAKRYIQRRLIMSKRRGLKEKLNPEVLKFLK